MRKDVIKERDIKHPVKGYAVFRSGELLTHDPNSQGLSWKYPVIFSSEGFARMFVENISVGRGIKNLEIVVVNIKPCKK